MLLLFSEETPTPDRMLHTRHATFNGYLIIFLNACDRYGRKHEHRWKKNCKYYDGTNNNLHLIRGRVGISLLGGYIWIDARLLQCAEKKNAN